MFWLKEHPRLDTDTSTLTRCSNCADYDSTWESSISLSSYDLDPVSTSPDTTAVALFEIVHQTKTCTYAFTGSDANGYPDGVDYCSDHTVTDYLQLKIQYSPYCGIDEVFNDMTLTCEVPCELVPDGWTAIGAYEGADGLTQCMDDLFNLTGTSGTEYMTCTTCDTNVALILKDGDTACPVGTSLDSTTMTCYNNDPLSDNDNDGVENKCDPDYLDYDNSDCDGDGDPNGTDSDDDNDGLNDVYDPDSKDYQSTSTSNPDNYDECKTILDEAKQASNMMVSAHYPNLEIGYRSEKDFGYVEKIAEYPDCDYDLHRLFSCPKMYKFDASLNKCVQTDTLMGADADCTTQYNRTDFVDLSQITFDSRMLDYNLEPFKCYVEYSCTADYRIKKFDEVSCSDQLNTNELFIKTDSNTSDIVNTLEKDYSDWATKTDAEKQDIIDRLQTEKSLSDGTADGVSTQNMENGLSDINSSLGGLANQLDGKNSDGTDIDNTEQLNSYTQLDGVLTTITDGFDSIGQDYQNMKDRIDQGLSYTSPRTGTTAPLTATVFNQQINFDLCSSFSAVSNIFYYIFTMVFLYLAIKLYWYGFLISLKD